MVKISSSQLLLRLLKYPETTEDWRDVDFSELSELAAFFQIEPLTFSLLKNRQAPLPPKHYSELKARYLHSLAKNLTFWQEFLVIHQAFTKTGIPVVPLKGMDFLTRFYPCFETRTMVDIDILVNEDQYEDAACLLQELGYKKILDGLREEYWRNKHCHIKFYKEPVCVELHWALDSKRGGGPLLPRLWERTQKRQVQDQAIRILSAEDAFFSYALHLRRFGGSLPLKQVFDVGRILEENRDFSWDYVLDQNRQCRIQATAFFLLIQVALYTNARIPERILTEIRIRKWQKKAIRHFITASPFRIDFSAKMSYLKTHFLLYDSILEPARYIVTIPYEQFCKFYDLPPYTRKSDFLYNWRLIYIPIQFVLSCS